MHGLHLTADLRGCRAQLPIMGNADALRRLCLASVSTAGLRPVGELFQAFPQPGGVTGMVLLAESHLAVHTWPEHGYAAVDIFTCNLDADIDAGIEAISKHLLPARTQVMEVRRGLQP